MQFSFFHLSNDFDSLDVSAFIHSFRCIIAIVCISNLCFKVRGTRACMWFHYHTPHQTQPKTKPNRTVPNQIEYLFIFNTAIRWYSITLLFDRTAYVFFCHFVPLLHFLFTIIVAFRITSHEDESYSHNWKIKMFLLCNNRTQGKKGRSRSQ